MSADDPLSDEDELLAAEIAFGLIDGDESRAAVARLTTEAAFAAAHRRWLGYAAGLLAGPDSVPSPAVWRAIAARLPANDVGISRATLRRWQAGTAAASAAAIVLAVIAIDRSQPLPTPAPVIVQAPRPAAPLVAVLTGGPGKGVLTVTFDSATGRLTSAPAGLAIGDRAAELWVIPPGQSPRSLGVIAAGAPGWTSAPAAAATAIAPGATLAVSVEPPGGSPTGQPTGPVILTGTVATI